MELFFQADDYPLLNYILLDSRQRRVIERANAVFKDDLAKVSNAFDDNDSTFYELSSTNSTKPWIQLELLDTGSIKQIRIFNQLGGCGVTISKTEVRVGNIKLTANNVDDMEKSHLCGKYEKEEKKGEDMDPGKNPSQTKCTAEDKEDNEITGEVVIITCPTSLTGKYVTLVITDEQDHKYDIAEVEVYGQITGR